MNRLVINLNALHDNIQTIDKWITDHDASWTLVTKVLCGHSDTLKALKQLGIRSIADSRLANLITIEDIIPDVESWYLRLPHISVIDTIVQLADVSLNSETEIIEELNSVAAKQGKIHRIIVMIELGDLREGILPGTLIDFYNHVFRLSNIEVLGIGANLGCLSGSVPSIDQLMQLVLYRELLELKFERKLPTISAGSSILLPLLLEGSIPKSINHFRIGEAAFLGTDLINGGMLPGLRDDAFILEAEVVELKEKSLIPMGETSATTPFESVSKEEYSPGQRGYRAVLTMGQLDTDVAGLRPCNSEHVIAGASSDVMVVNVGENPESIAVGDTIKFKPSYGALVRLMISKYIDKIVTPSVSTFSEEIVEEDAEVPVGPVIEEEKYS